MVFGPDRFELEASRQDPDRVISSVEFVVSQVSKSRPGAPILVQEQAIRDMVFGPDRFELEARS